MLPTAPSQHARRLLAEGRQTPTSSAWSFAEERLSKSHNYWICSPRPDVRPHSTPVWSIWLDEAFYFSTDPASRKGQNLKANSAVSVHVESGDEPVILGGSR